MQQQQQQQLSVVATVYKMSIAIDMIGHKSKLVKALSFLPASKKKCKFCSVEMQCSWLACLPTYRKGLTIHTYARGTM